nr:class I SAM-dependent methyltransferase [Corynebacterium sp. TAE3-ERU12]
MRADLPGAQQRRIAAMMQAAQVRASSRVLEWPSSGGSLAMAAAQRGAAADVVVNSSDMAAAVGKNIAEAGMSSYVKVLRSRDSIPSAREFPTDYDAIICAERLETLGMAGLLRWLKTADRVLAERGRIVLHLPVAVGDSWGEVGPALDFVRSYIWPALYYPQLPELRRLIERDTGLRVVEHTHFAGHYEHTLRMWRELFAAQSRQAAGLGYDRVYRRLWEYYLALQEALVRTGRLDMVQLTLTVAPPRRR